MSRFRKPAPPPTLAAGADPLAAVPRVPADVEAGVDNLGLVQVRRRYQPRSRLGRLLRFRYQRQVHLDAAGSFYWRQLDGARDLETIAALFSGQYSCPLVNARRAVIAFTRDLMRRDLVELRLPPPTGAPRDREP